jgi:hypothetical protein
MKEQAFKKQSNQHTSWRLEASSPSGGVAVIQMEALHKYDGWKEMGGLELEEVLELVVEVNRIKIVVEKQHNNIVLL